MLQVRQWGLSGMLDLVDYSSACLIYGDAMYRSPIAQVLARVRSSEISLDTAIAQIAHDEVQLP